MSNLTVFDFSGKNIRFERRGDRVWVSLTDMAKVSEQSLNDYFSLESTASFLATENLLIETQSVTRVPIGQRDGIKNILEIEESVWVDERVAIHFASWCSVHFQVWTHQQIENLTKNNLSQPAAQPTTPATSI